MFYPQLITDILPGDRVLEIGPGSSPHPRSDVLLEKDFSELELEKQRGHTPPLETGKPVIFYSEEIFPFIDKEFDYCICSHVLEHVDDIDKFLSEIFRVAYKGYFEFPTIMYEYLYNFGVHRNILLYKNNTLIYCKKSDTRLDEFIPVQAAFSETLRKGYSKVVDELNPLMFQGFQWSRPFLSEETRSLSQLVPDQNLLNAQREMNRSFSSRLRSFIKKVAR